MPTFPPMSPRNPIKSPSEERVEAMLRERKAPPQPASPPSLLSLLDHAESLEQIINPSFKFSKLTRQLAEVVDRTRRP